MPNNALSESFDNGTGAIGNAWNVNTSVRGQVTLSGNSGLMEWATGRDAGHGYGTYTITAKVDGNQPGPAIVFWPGDNRWPGQEIDMAEITPDGSGRQYGAVHWNNNGSDAANYVIFDGVSGGVFHDYQMVWEPGRITFRVDGAEKGVVTDHVPTDYDHGGMNNTIGFLNNNPNTSITVSHVDFRPSGGGASPTPPAQTGGSTTPTQPTTPTTQSGATDWNALAAQVTANYEATGSWSSAPAPAQTGGSSTPVQPSTPPAPSAPAPQNGATDWNALAAQVTANYEATGSWSSAPAPAQTGGVSSAPAQPSAPSAPAPQSGATDWNAIAAQMTANYEATGTWFI